MITENTATREAAIDITDVDLASRDGIERSFEIRCASGRRSMATWRGTPISAIVEGTAIPAETTHLVVASGDGYCACLDVHTALHGLLAVTRDGTPIDEADSPRFVAPDIEGIRMVKGVSTIEPVSLAPAEDPERFEAFESGTNEQ
jgi:DMSO/TMAO reductase YedYZ molybdopterin-dependent catalytic subunit